MVFDRKTGHRQSVAWATLLSVCTATATLTFAGISANALAKAKSAPKPHHEAVNANVETGAKKFEELDPKNFDKSENIDHPWWPLKPGMQWVYEGYTEEDGKRTPHRIVFTVTDFVKEIAGVRCRVVFDADYAEGQLTEKELTYFAQDKAGNVWHLGQYREVYETEFVGGRIWHVDNPEGAKAGIMMPAAPKAGTPSYSEGYAPPPFNWTDRGRVYKTGQKTKVRHGNYDDVLVIEEFDAETPGAFQLKYYAKGVGNIRVGWRGDKSAGTESMELVKATMLSDQEMNDIRAKALDLEKRGSMFPKDPPMAKQ